MLLMVFAGALGVVTGACVLAGKICECLISVDV